MFVAFFSSPADSVDSGVSCLGSLLSSPSSSPNLSPVHAPKEVFFQNGQFSKLFFTQRNTTKLLTNKFVGVGF